MNYVGKWLGKILHDFFVATLVVQTEDVGVGNEVEYIIAKHERRYEVEEEVHSNLNPGNAPAQARATDLPNQVLEEHQVWEEQMKNLEDQVRRQGIRKKQYDMEKMCN